MLKGSQIFGNDGTGVLVINVDFEMDNDPQTKIFDN